MSHNTQVNIGDIFGKLKVVRKIDESVCVCECACGGCLITSKNKLLGGIVSSCGCKKRGRKTYPVNIIGKKFGDLIVVCRDGKLSNHWICKCKCGGYISATRTELFSREITHCNGCEGGNKYE